MVRRFAIILFALLAALALPLTALAAEDESSDGFIFKVDGSITIAASERVDSVILVNGNAVVDGTVDETVWVLNGNATINGRVDGDVVVFNGTLYLSPSAVVNNVSVVRGDLNRDPNATVTGEIHERSAFISFGWGSAVFSFVFWFGTTIPLVAFGLLFAAVAGRQLTAGGTMLTEQTGKSVVAAVLLWFGIPLVALAAILTLIGIPLGIILFLAMPLLWVAGYVTAATRLGVWLTALAKIGPRPEHPYLAATVGVVFFQLVGLIPFLGGLAVALAGLVGAGALAALAVASRQRRKTTQRPAGLTQQPRPVA